MTPKIYTINGRNFSDFSGLIDEFNRVYFCGTDYCWDGDLDVFNDYIHTSTPFTLRWLDSEKSRRDLGFEEMAAWLTAKLDDSHCHPSNLPAVRARLEEANSGRGITFFEWIIETIECRPGVELELS